MSTSVSTVLFELIHADVWGPYKIKTHGNCSSFHTLVKNLSRTTWVFLLPDKTHVSHLLATFFVFVKNQFNTSVKVLRTDNGTEFVNS